MTIEYITKLKSTDKKYFNEYVGFFEENEISLNQYITVNIYLQIVLDSLLLDITIPSAKNI